MSKQFIIIALLLNAIFFDTLAQPKLAGVSSFKKENQTVFFECENKQTVKLNVVDDDIIRVQVSPDGKFEQSITEKLGYIKNDFAPTSFDFEEKQSHYVLSTNALKIVIDKQQFSLNVEDKSGNLIVRNNKLNGIQSGEKNVLNFDMPADEHFFGFGFMRKTLDARGHKLTFKRDYRWKEATVPYFMSTRGYAFYSNSVFNHYFDFTCKSDDGKDDYYSITTNDGVIDFYIIYGPDFPKLLDRYTDLTGKSMMIPRWAFGLQYRLRYFGDQEELLGIAREFRNKEIPCDMMALEPGWEEKDYSMKWKWSPERFPEPKKMIDELGEMGFKLDLWESGKAPFANVTDLKTRQDWYAKRKEIVDMGVKMFKQDDPYPRSIKSTELLDPVMAKTKYQDKILSPEELNNLANTLYTETLFDEFRKQTNERAVVMFHAYNASVASHRWPFQWAGDFQAENGMLNASLSGHAMVSYDIRNPYAAGWHQGFFTPFSVVDAWAYYREPWLYSESIEQSHRLYACLRSRLVPYFYTSLWQSTKTGLPIERPMVLDYHDDPITHHMKSQFMVGDWFLLALSDVDDSPAGEKIDFWTGMQKGNHGRIYLPKGKWVNYWNGEVKDIKKAQWVKGEWPEYLGGLLYVKAGAIIPMGQVKNYIGETEDEVVVLDVYPDGETSYQLYEDDGITYKYEDKEFSITDISCQQEDSRVKISVSARKGNYEGMPEKRTYLVKMHSLTKPKSIFIDNIELNFFDNKEALIFSANSNGWYYDCKNKKAIIKIDKGWKYVETEENKDPLATIPLTAKNERIELSRSFKTISSNREILVELPTLAVAKFESNISTLPADKVSKAIINVHFDNLKEDIGELNFKISGSATFTNGLKEMKVNESGDISFEIVAGNIPGEIQVMVLGSKVEPGSFSIPVHGKPIALELEKDRTVLVADNENILNLSAKLYDAGGCLVPNTGSPVVLKVEGPAVFENGTKTDSVYVKDGQAAILLKSTLETGKIKLTASFNNLENKSLETSSEKGELQVRINPPEKVKLNSDGGWIPDYVDVFVNFKAAGQLVRNSSKKVTLNVYSKQNELLDTYVQDAEKGEVIFKDISYYKRPAQCLFEIKCEGYDTVTRKVFANTWEQDPNAKSVKKKGGH